MSSHSPRLDQPTRPRVGTCALCRIPLKAATILRISPPDHAGGGSPLKPPSDAQGSPAEATASMVEGGGAAAVGVVTVGGPLLGLNKWEGGVMANDGSM